MKTRKRRKSSGSTTTVEGYEVSQRCRETKSIRNPSVQHAPLRSLPIAFLAAPQHGEDKIWGRDKGPPSAATSLSFLVDLACKTDEFPDALQLVPFRYRPWFCHTNPTIRKSEHTAKSPFFPHDYIRHYGCDVASRLPGTLRIGNKTKVDEDLELGHS